MVFVVFFFFEHLPPLMLSVPRNPDGPRLIHRYRTSRVSVGFFRGAQTRTARVSQTRTARVDAKNPAGGHF